jgi:murein hydrolase activator
MRSLLYLCFYLLSFPTFGQQSQDELEKEITHLRQKIDETNRILDMNQQDQQLSLGRLSDLNQQIEQRQVLSTALNLELRLIEKQSSKIRLRVIELENELQKYREEYAAMVYMASKTNNSLKKLSYLFASDSFHQLMSRLRYFRQYATDRKRQIEQIQQKQNELIGQQTDVNELKRKKASLLQLQQAQYAELQKLVQNDLLENLRIKEKELREIYEKHEQEAEKQAQLIAKTIAESEAKRKKGPAIRPTPESIAAGTFEENKGKLIWPVKEGFVSQKFGKQYDPVFEKVQIDNLGVEIRTNPNEQVRSVFGGTVKLVHPMPNGIVIMVQHDATYYTVYAGLKEANIRKGQTVSAKTPIGIVQSNEEGSAEFQFQIWKNSGGFESVKMNPEEWLAE